MKRHVISLQALSSNAEIAIAGATVGAKSNGLFETAAHLNIESNNVEQKFVEETTGYTVPPCGCTLYRRTQKADVTFFTGYGNFSRTVFIWWTGDSGSDNHTWRDYIVLVEWKEDYGEELLHGKCVEANDGSGLRSACEVDGHIFFP